MTHARQTQTRWAARLIHPGSKDIDPSWLPEAARGWIDRRAGKLQAGPEALVRAWVVEQFGLADWEGDAAQIRPAQAWPRDLLAPLGFVVGLAVNIPTMRSVLRGEYWRTLFTQVDRATVERVMKRHAALRLDGSGIEPLPDAKPVDAVALMTQGAAILWRCSLRSEPGLRQRAQLKFPRRLVEQNALPLSINDAEQIEALIMCEFQMQGAAT